MEKDLKWTAIAALAAILLALISGCVQDNGQATGNNSEQNTNETGNAQTGVGNLTGIQKGDKIKVEYVGSFESGEVFDKSEGRGPLEFTAGAGQMIPGFDEAVIGMKLNEEKTVTIPPEKAYGNAQEMTVPKSQIQVGQELTVGMQLGTSTGATATITKIEDENVTLSVGHPLAGKTLRFWIKVIDIQSNNDSPTAMPVMDQ